jgi:hypothetical protein
VGARAAGGLLAYCFRRKLVQLVNHSRRELRNRLPRGGCFCAQCMGDAHQAVMLPSMLEPTNTTVGPSIAKPALQEL